MAALVALAGILFGTAAYCCAMAALGGQEGNVGKALRMIRKDRRRGGRASAFGGGPGGGGRLPGKGRPGGAGAVGNDPGQPRAGGALPCPNAASARRPRLGTVERIALRFVRLGPERREALGKKLLRAGFGGSPEEFCAIAATRALAVLACAPVFWALGVTLASLGCACLAASLYYKRFNDLDARLKAVRVDIEDELPRFVSVINYSMSTDRDLTRTIGRYLKICKPSFRYDLELLYLELKGGNAEDALKRFDSRIDIPQLSTFVSGLIDAGRGVDQKTFFYLMEENMKQLFISNKRKELSRRPAKIKKAIIATGMCLFVLYLVPIGMQLARGFALFE